MVNQKINKFVNYQEKYIIRDQELKKSLSFLLDGFIKIEIFYNNFLFKNSDFEMGSKLIDISDSNKLTNDRLNINNKEVTNLMYSSNNSSSTNINDKKLNESIGDISINMSTDNININSYRNAILSDYIKTLKIGYLIPVDCGHNGCFNQAELDLFSFYLLNSNLLN